jgi:neutral ceramidase
MNYAVQPALWPSAGPGRLVSADLAGVAADHVERAYDTVALFLVGAAGDQAPRPGAGEALGAAAVQICERIDGTDGDPVLRLVRDQVEVGAQPLPPRESLRPRVAYDYRADGTTIVPLWVARIGDLALAAVRPELTSVTGRWIKDRSPFPGTFVLTMVNGAAKYLPDARGYQRITYAAMNSPYAAGAAERVAARLVEVLRGLR